MLEVQAGEVWQLGTLFDRHHAGLFRYAVRMTGDRSRADDLVQEIFCRMLRYRETFRSGYGFTTWMYRIARNAHIDRARKGKWEMPSDAAREPAVPPSAELEQQQDMALLRQALQRLPEQQRELLILARFEQLPYDQIAEVLGVETGTVKTRVHRAIKQLRDIYFELTRTPYALRTSS